MNRDAPVEPSTNVTFYTVVEERRIPCVIISLNGFGQPIETIYSPHQLQRLFGPEFPDLPDYERMASSATLDIPFGHDMSVSIQLAPTAPFKPAIASEALQMLRAWRKEYLGAPHQDEDDRR